MNLAPGRARAEQFAGLLELDGKTHDPALAPYLALAGALRAVPAAAGPTPEFRAGLRQRLVAVATVQGVGQDHLGATERVRAAGSTWRVQRRLAVVAGGAAAVTAIAGVGVGASRSLPGDPFYGVKRATERVQLAAATGQEAKGKRHLEFARTRLSEVEALIGHSSALSPFLPGTAGAVGPLTESAQASTIISTLADMDAETRAGADDLVSAARASGSAEPLQALDRFTRAQFGTLRSILIEMPGQAQGRARLSLSLLTAVASRTVSVAASESPAGTPSGGGTATPSASAGHRGHPGSPAPAPTTGSAPAQTGAGGSTPPSTQPNPQPSVPALPNGGGSDAPTIPALPTKLPAPTSLPTSLPTLPLPSLPDLPGLGG